MFSVDKIDSANGSRLFTWELSKLGAKSTVSYAKSASMTADDTACSLHSV